MKMDSIILALALFAVSFVGCATQPAPRWVYKESQFVSHLEYVQFCQRYAMQDGRCD